VNLRPYAISFFAAEINCGSGSAAFRRTDARFRWLVTPHSTVIQTSTVHSGVAHDLDAALANLFETLVRMPA
jgi:hypothetical protein